MSEYEQAVFVSYAWGKKRLEHELILTQLNLSLLKQGFKIVCVAHD